MREEISNDRFQSPKSTTKPYGRLMAAYLSGSDGGGGGGGAKCDREAVKHRKDEDG